MATFFSNGKSREKERESSNCIALEFDPCFLHRRRVVGRHLSTFCPPVSHMDAYQFTLIELIGRLRVQGVGK